MTLVPALSLSTGVGVMGGPLTKLLARTPGIAVSTVVTAALASLLPGPLGWVVILGALVLAVALAAGKGEPAAVRALLGARALTPAEAAALAPVIVVLCQWGLGPPLVDLYLCPKDGRWPRQEPATGPSSSRRNWCPRSVGAGSRRIGRPR
jgi:hypothetical protein